MNFKFKYQVEFNKSKSLLLKETRGVSFEDLLQSVSEGNILDDKKHYNVRLHPNQRLLIVKKGNYAYVIPYIIDEKKKIVFLKTAYPNSVLIRIYLKK